MNPFTLFTLQSQIATLLFETQIVMTLRVMAMSGAIPARKGENYRMVAEKAPAMNLAIMLASRAAMAGKRPDQILSAAIRPLSRKVHSNRKRLMR